MIDLTEYRARTAEQTLTIVRADAPASGPRITRSGHRLDGHRLIDASHRFGRSYDELPPAA
jgi:hypothetical protein